MRGIFSLALVFALATACQNDEDIFAPQPPSVDRAGPVGAPELPKQSVLPPFDAKSELFQEGVFNGMPFRILFPRGYNPSVKYPLHIFLHGIGERGADNQKQLSLGASYFQLDSIREKYPAFIVFPQCPDTHFWFSESITATLKTLMDSLVKDQSINIEALSIGGFSMGGYGTFAMVAAYPDFFQSAVAISGDGDESRASSMAKARWRLFAGEKDDVVPSWKTAKMARALAESGASVAFTVYPGADHGSTWFRAFSEPDFFHWLFSGDYAEPEIAQHDTD